MCDGSGLHTLPSTTKPGKMIEEILSSTGHSGGLHGWYRALRWLAEVPAAEYLQGVRSKAGEMARQLRAYIILLEDPSWLPSIHIK